MGAKNTGIMEENNGINTGDRSEEKGDRIIQLFTILLSLLKHI